MADKGEPPELVLKGAAGAISLIAFAAVLAAKEELDPITAAVVFILISACLLSLALGLKGLWESRRRRAAAGRQAQ